MKTGIKQFSKALWTVALLWLCGTIAFANPNGKLLEAIKTKTVNQTFKVSNGDELAIENRYGEITITHWNRNEVEIRVEIETRAENDQLAQTTLDRISIETQQVDNKVNANTQFANSNRTNNANISYNIRYFVQMPARLKAQLNQKYGNINLPNKDNHEMAIAVKYGNLKGGDFVGNLALEAKYSNVALGNLKNADMELGYAGDVKIGDADRLQIEVKYSQIEMQKVKTLQMENKYSNFTIEEADELRFDMKYAGGTVSRLTSSLIASEFDYSNLKVKQVDKQFKEVRINARYSNVKLNIPASASFKVDADGLKYGSCKLSGFKVSEDEISNNTHRCTVNGGKQGLIRFNGNGYSNLKINSL